MTFIKSLLEPSIKPLLESFITGLRDGLMSGQVVALLMLLMDDDYMWDITPKTVMDGTALEFLVLYTSIVQCGGSGIRNMTNKLGENFGVIWVVTVAFMRLFTNVLILWQPAGLENVQYISEMRGVDSIQYPLMFMRVLWYFTLFMKMCWDTMFLTLTTVVTTRYRGPNSKQIYENTFPELAYILGYGYIYGITVFLNTDRRDAIFVGAALMMLDQYIMREKMEDIRNMERIRKIGKGKHQYPNAGRYFNHDGCVSNRSNNRNNQFIRYNEHYENDGDEYDIEQCKTKYE